MLPANPWQGRKLAFKQANKARFARRRTRFTLSRAVPHRRNVYQPSGNLYTNIRRFISRLGKPASRARGTAYSVGTHVAHLSSLDDFIWNKFMGAKMRQISFERKVNARF